MSSASLLGLPPQREARILAQALWHTVCDGYLPTVSIPTPALFVTESDAFMKSVGIEIEIRDTLRDPVAYSELLDGGGRGTVPCLRIARGDEVRWLYESRDIIEYLDRNFSR